MRSLILIAYALSLCYVYGRGKRVRVFTRPWTFDEMHERAKRRGQLDLGAFMLSSKGRKHMESMERVERFIEKERQEQIARGERLPPMTNLLTGIR